MLQFAGSFFSFESVLENGYLSALTSVDVNIFEFLLDVLLDFKSHAMRVQDCLLLFLMKLKFSLPFVALAAIFSSKPATVRDIFYRILDDLCFEYVHSFLQKLLTCTFFRIQEQEMIPWLTRELTKEYLPDSFKRDFPACRAIIDCSEVRVEKPGGLREQNALYSYYKSGHTIKFLISKFLCHLPFLIRILLKV